MARDRDVFNAMRDALVADGNFPVILLHQDLTKRPGDVDTVIALRREGWSSEEIADGEQVRKVQYRAFLSHIENDPETCFDALDRLENAFLNAVDGVSLGGITLPQWTYCGKGADVREASSPEGRVTLSGSFAYLVDGWSAADESA